MKAIAISGSARAAGNTEILLRQCLGVLEKEGIETELVRLSDKTITPCKACTTCYKRKDGKCFMSKDDFQPIFDKMVEADIIILGSPVYFGSASANLTALMDRAGYVARANGNLFERKLGGPVVVARRAGQNFTLAQIQFWFMILGMVVPGSTYWNMGFGLAPGDVEQDTEAIDTVRGFAENLAWLAKKLR
jgi:multimeric flavodoxin WrbA